jgi:hypothetical protein
MNLNAVSDGEKHIDMYHAMLVTFDFFGVHYMTVSRAVRKFEGDN